MRIMRKHLLIFLMILIQLSGTLQANKKRVPIPAKELVGIWVGFDKYYAFSFTRLDLRAGLSGYVSVGGGRPLGVYRISNAQYDGYHFTMDLVPISNDAEDGVHVSARSGLAFMDLQIHGKGYWELKHEVRLFPEKDVDDFNRQAKEAIEAATR